MFGSAAGEGRVRAQEDLSHSLADLEGQTLVGTKPCRAARYILGGFYLGCPVLVVDRRYTPGSTSEEDDGALAAEAQFVENFEFQVAGEDGTELWCVEYTQ